MSWLQLTFPVAEADIPRVETLLDALGAVSVTFADALDAPILEPAPGEQPMWNETLVTGLFAADCSRDLLLEQIMQAGFPPSDVVLEYLEDRDWEREWMTHFQPMAFGQRLWIVPSWARTSWLEQADPGAVALYLDPGLAFGTGTHPTTRLCLGWLDSLDLKGRSLLDYGCGSGILAIAAALLGARPVHAVDIDPQAIDATLDNAHSNHVQITTSHIPDTGPPISLPEADVVVANILANPLISLAPLLVHSVRPGGRIGLSGILREQADAVQQAYAPWITFHPPDVDEDWVLLTGYRSPGP